jgi:hypothetical protein
MKRLLTSVVIVTLAAIGVPIATATSASAAAPSTGQLDAAWTRICATVTPPSVSSISHVTPSDVYTCAIDPFVGAPSDGPQTPGLQALCRAMGGIYLTDLINGSGGIYTQNCVVLH